MPKYVRNRAKEKLKYFTSDIDDASIFFKQTYGKWNGTMTKATTGRRKEKEQRKREIETKAIERAKQEAIDNYKIPKDKLLNMKKTAVELLLLRLNDFIPKKDKDGNTLPCEKVNVKDISEIIKTAKIELNEPIVVSKTYTANLEGELDPEEEKAVKELLELNKE